MTSLKEKAISGIFWSFFQKFGTQGIFVAVNIVLVRLLTPEDFGLVGMIAILISVSQALSSAGFSTALIQKKDADEEDYSSVFYINLVISIIIYSILFFAAPFIAVFYRQPVLVSLTRVLSLVFVFNAFSYIQETRLRKDIRFKTLMIVHIPSSIIGGAVSILMAILGLGVWSIVAMQVLTSFSYAVQLWVYSKWKPLFRFNGRKVRELFSFGSKVAISDIIHFAYLNIYPVVLGKFFTLKSVGYYQTANKLAMTPSVTYLMAINNATFPLLTSIQNDNDKLKRIFRRGLRQLVFWICPLFILMAALANPLIHFVFTERWISAVPYFRLLCVVWIFVPMNIYNIQLLNVKGRSGLYMKLNVLEKIILIIGIIVALPFGIWLLLLMQALTSIFIYFFNSYFSSKMIKYSLVEHLNDILPVFLLSIGVGGIVLLLNTSVSGVSDLSRLILGFSSGILLYWAFVRYFHFASYFELVDIVRSKVLPKLYFRKINSE